MIKNSFFNLFNNTIKEPRKEEVEQGDKNHEEGGIDEDSENHFPSRFTVRPTDLSQFFPRVTKVAAEVD